ncbi:MAG: tRNA pseudouridine(55) synthase TruB [Candidatus Latescibacterota bacterium]
MDGILVIDKEPGPTSHDVVAQVRRLLGQPRVGHCGTLDPLATGVLVICLGRYTRLSQWLGDEDKEYQATFVLGATSDTGDAQGQVNPSPIDPAGPEPDREAMLSALHGLEGVREQVPPAYSAVKVHGVPSYRLARRDAAVPLAPRTVRVNAVNLVGYEYPRVEVRVECGKGTYVRSLAVELGERLGCGGYVEALRRLRAGTLDLGRAVSMDRLARATANGSLADCLVPVEEALSGIPRVVLEAESDRSFCHGNPVPFATAATTGSVAAVFDAAGSFRGIGAWDRQRGVLAPRAVLVGPETEVVPGG